MASVLLIDNYDSFTFNLVQYLRELGADVVVHRNDQIGVDEALAMEPTHVVISPGPGRPEDAGISIPVIEAVLGATPLLGVCLGHQALVQVYGGRIVRAPRLMHGKASDVFHDGEAIYRGLPNPMPAARYHSLAADEGAMPDELVVTAYTSEGEIMGVRSKSCVAEGVQYHPESILTPHGKTLLANFLGTS